MWTCIGYLTYLMLAHGDMRRDRSHYIGTYNSEQSCMISGEKWVNRNKKPQVKATFSCEKEINNRVVSL